ncbi:MAG TPA: alpha/beta hydrolase [Steroidobacteraceae bacterium]|nr:alpha/beta hydrolase [Steroidobacteraceae bacterium]
MTTFEQKYKSRSLYYRVRGKGDNLLLIHGLGSSGADWEFQVRALERHFRVIVPDLPGSGYSPPFEEDFSIGDCADVLWALMDHLQVSQANIAGFSLGGAVALEMALQRPQSVARLAMINTLLSYRIDHWRKWLEARVPAIVIRLIGMRCGARLAATRLFPMPWQRVLRERAAEAIGRVASKVYLGMAKALERWTAIERLEQLQTKTLMIAAEHDFTPLAEKMSMARAVRADIAIVHGSRHRTPFDSIKATNACLLAWFTDRPVRSSRRWVCDQAPASGRLSRIARFVEEQTALNRLEFGA